MTTTEPVSAAAQASDAELIRAVRDGDSGAYGTLYERHSAAARRLATQFVRAAADDLPDPGDPFVDPAIAKLENSLIRSAFMSLPERWTAVLWHTEIEQSKPAEVALLLGLTPNGVAALSYRAREALRQAYLQMHLSAVTSEECRPVVGRLGAHVRGALSRRDGRRVDSHLRRCGDCRAAHDELVSINGALRGLLAPIVLGGAAAGYLAEAGGHASAGAGQ